MGKKSPNARANAALLRTKIKIIVRQTFILHTIEPFSFFLPIVKCKIYIQEGVIETTL
jgi:hypothetical protein